MRSETYKQAMEAFRRGDADLLQSLIDPVIEADSSSPESLGLRYLRGSAYEWGKYPGGADLNKALVDYRTLESWAPTIGSEVLVAAGRILFDMNERGNADEIERLCIRAIELDRSVHAKMLLGLLYEKVRMDSVSARKWYLSAYLGGLPWGLRYFARSHAKQGDRVRSMLAHIAATVTSPILVLMNGARGPFSDSV
ncbi:MAG TPA: hypothetical protein PK743_02230 [Luteimonas sp.]|nr:hypothetical protein [Luteimonas sp.]